MDRVCFILHVRPARLDEYRARHRDVWPEMLAALRAAGWENYSLFLRRDGLLVGYFETADFDRAMAISGAGINERWQREMAPFFEAPDGGAGARPDLTYERLEEVFHLGRETA